VYAACNRINLLAFIQHIVSDNQYETTPSVESDELANDVQTELSEPKSVERAETVQFSISSYIGSQIVWMVDTLSVYPADEITDGEINGGYYLLGKSISPSQKSGWDPDEHRDYIPDGIGEEGWYIEPEMFENNKDELEQFVESYNRGEETDE